MYERTNQVKCAMVNDLPGPDLLDAVEGAAELCEASSDSIQLGLHCCL